MPESFVRREKSISPALPARPNAPRRRKSPTTKDVIPKIVLDVSLDVRGAIFLLRFLAIKFYDCLIMITRSRIRYFRTTRLAIIVLEGNNIKDLQ